MKTRFPNVDDVNEKGIPRDFAAVMDYFNGALENNSLPWIPRKTPITESEIIEKWIPSLESNIVIVAEHEGKVVGQATVFYEPNSTNYERAKQRMHGEMSSTVDPAYDVQTQVKIQEALAKGIIKELKNQNKTAFLRVAKESPMTTAMSNLGYVGKASTAKHYKEAGLSGEVLEYNFP